MLYSVPVIFWVIGLLFVRYSYKKWTSYRAVRAAEAQHGCKPPPKYPHRDPFFGIDLLKERKTAVGAGRLMRTQAEWFDLCGKTYEEKFFDVKVINTMQAQNILQITALSFNDYGKANLISTAPMTGKGILFHDGVIWKRSRDMIKPTFARTEISDVALLQYHFDRFLDMIPRDGTTIDLQDPLHNLVNDPSLFSLGIPY